jgi:hypothetical protein
VRVVVAEVEVAPAEVNRVRRKSHPVVIRSSGPRWRYTDHQVFEVVMGVPVRMVEVVDPVIRLIRSRQDSHPPLVAPRLITIITTVSTGILVEAERGATMVTAIRPVGINIIRIISIALGPRIWSAIQTGIRHR